MTCFVVRAAGDAWRYALVPAVSMKRVTIKLLGVVLWSASFMASNFAQPGAFDFGKIPKLGEIGGLTSLSESHLAVWYSNVRKDQTPSYEAFLVIFELRDGEPAEVYRTVSRPEDLWQRLIPLSTFNLTGLIIQSSYSLTDNDAALVIALVDGKFQVVFRGGTSEILDLNGDGIPEIFESMWPDGDGYPKTTAIHIWTGKTYRPLMKTSWRNRFGPGVLSSVEKASRRITRASRANKRLQRTGSSASHRQLARR